MKILCLSDTHGKHVHFTNQIDNLIRSEQVDCLVYAGDMSSRGYTWEIEDFLAWYSSFDVKHRVAVAGNHDFAFEDQSSPMKEILKKYPNIIYLEQSEVILDGVKFYGSPYTPRFFNWAFNVDRGDDIREYWLQIPLDTDVLITPGPPMGILDETKMTKKKVGCEELMDVISSQLNLKLHVFGHIHSAHGILKRDSTLFVNASLLNDDYMVVYEPVVVQI